MFRLALALAAVAGTASADAIPVATPSAPLTRMEIVRDTLFGTVIADPYRWLEDKDAPATRAWLKQQDEYLHAVMAAVPGRDRIRARLDSLRRTDDVSIPTERAGRLFFLKRSANQDQRVLVMRRGAAGKDEVLLDPNALSPDHTVTLRLLDVAANGGVVVVGFQQGGEDEIEVKFLDVATRKFRAESLPHARYMGVQFSGDAKSVYYARFSKEGPRILRHTLGTEPRLDAPLYGEGLGRDLIAGVAVSEGGKWLLIGVSHGSAGDQVDLYLKNLQTNGPVTTIVNDIAARFDGRFGGDTLFVRTNWKAPRGRVLAIDLAHPSRDQWREVVPEAKGVIDGWTLAGGRLLVNYILNVVAQVYLIGVDGKVMGPVPVGENGAVRGLTGRWNGPDAYLTFESFNVPPRILRVTMAINDVTSWWASAIPFRTEDYEVSQAWFASKDGTRIPMFISRRKDVVLDGTNPVYLTGYGGFAQNRVPRFSVNAALWMENGGVWAEPALRGGSEFGEDWHQAGMLSRKQNVFDDFLAAAEWLIKRRFTSKERLAIGGGSNGGLLVGAALTQRPDLFRAVICSAPLLDMLRYHHFLVARFWVPEYGSSEDSAQFRALRAYSPYHRVRIGERYPAVMLVSGDSDTRVDPLHARKMTALLQSATGSERPVLLHYDAASGHSGGKPIARQIEDDTDTMQFLFWQLGITPRDGAPPPLPPSRDTRSSE